MNQLTPDQINRILAANTARCTPEAAAQIAAGQLTTEQWQQTVRMTAELIGDPAHHEPDRRTA